MIRPSPTFWRTRFFWSLCIGLFLGSYVYGVAVVALAWLPFQSRWNTTLVLLWPPVSLAIGLAIGGWLADWRGRRRLLTWSPVGYMAGSLLVSQSTHLYATLTGVFCLLVTAGIDANTLLTYAQELPWPTRRQALTVELNFVNLGSIVLATLALYTNRIGLVGLREIISIIPFSLSLFLLVLRPTMKESPLWQMDRQRQPRVSLSGFTMIRIAVAAAFAIANTAGFSLLAYAFGTDFLPHHFHRIFIVSAVAAWLVGPFTPKLLRYPPKPTIVISYGLAVAAAVALRVIRQPHHPAFWPSLFLLSVCGSVAYATEDTLNPSQWPAVLRARTLATIRIVALMVYAVIVVWARSAHINSFLTVIVGVWALGWVAALVWWAIAGPISAPKSPRH